MEIRGEPIPYRPIGPIGPSPSVNYPAQTKPQDSPLVNIVRRGFAKASRRGGAGRGRGASRATTWWPAAVADGRRRRRYARQSARRERMASQARGTRGLSRDPRVYPSRSGASAAKKAHVKSAQRAESGTRSQHS